MYDYNAPEVARLAEAIEMAIYAMNQDMPNFRQLAFISSSRAQAAKGILDELDRRSVFTSLPPSYPLHRDYFPYAFDLREAVSVGMANENQGYVCSEWPEFFDYLYQAMTSGPEPLYVE